MTKSRLLLLSAASAAVFASTWLLHVSKADESRSSVSAHASQESATSRKEFAGRGIGSAQLLQAASHATAKAKSDFDGDGRSDLMLTNPLNAWYAYWTMSGPDVLSYSPVLEQPRGSYPLAVDDFNGDGRSEVLFIDNCCGRPGETSLHLALSDGNVANLSLFNVGSSDPSAANKLIFSNVIGTGDVNGDGKADILTAQNYSGGVAIEYFIMDSLTVVRGSEILTGPAGHLPVAFGDFNGDHRLDVIWHNKTTGSLVMWTGDGAAFVTAPIRNLNPGWEVWGTGDADGDGKDDLLLTNPSFRYFAYWTMDGATPVRYSPAFLLPGQGLVSRYGPVAAGDYNGDGKLDIVLSRETDQSLILWQGDGNGFNERSMPKHSAQWRVEPTFKVPGAPVKPYVTGDADGDGRSDALAIGLARIDFVKNEWSSYFNYWLYRGVRKSKNGFEFSFSLNGEPLASGDFDGDGRTDLVFERKDATTGAISTFIRLSSGYPAADVSIPTPAATWRIFGAGDVDGDGLSDLLLGQNLQSGPTVLGPEYRNPSMTGFAYWTMNRGKVGRYSLGFVTDSAAPRIAARGDFNGDGRMDLVWSSKSGASDRQARMWTGNGEGFSVASMLAPAPTWDIIAGGDLDANGKSDLILQNAQGSAFWFMDGAQVVAFSPGFLTGRIDTVGDYNGDGRMDLLHFAGQNFCDEASADVYFSNGIGLVPFGGGTPPPPAPPSPCSSYQYKTPLGVFTR